MFRQHRGTCVGNQIRVVCLSLRRQQTLARRFFNFGASMFESQVSSATATQLDQQLETESRDSAIQEFDRRSGRKPPLGLRPEKLLPPEEGEEEATRLHDQKVLDAQPSQPKKSRQPQPSPREALGRGGPSPRSGGLCSPTPGFLSTIWHPRSRCRVQRRSCRCGYGISRNRRLKTSSSGLDKLASRSLPW